VDQGGGLQRLPRLFLSHLVCGQFAKLGIDQGQKLRGSVRIALVDLL
jgi:hypothetical protein